MTTYHLDIIVNGKDNASGVLKGMAGALTNLGAVGLQVAAGGIAAVTGAIAASIKMAAGFEHTMSGVKAVLGPTSQEFNLLSQKALQLGKDTIFGASEAAGAIEMLAKNGLNATQILNGAADATVNLASATGADLSTSADIATDVMSVFGIEAGNMTSAVNGISGVVVNSKFDINDFALALAQGGGVASATGVEFDDFATAIAGISPLFASGSDAGTSFKVMLQRLVPGSKEAAGMMKQLGIITADGKNQFFDANGQLRDMSEIAGILQTSLSGLSEEEKNHALQTIFGTDAMRAAVGIAQLGTEGFNDLSAAIAQTDAAEQAAIRMDNLSGDIENLKGSLETAGIELGTAFIPLLREVTQGAIEWVNANLIGRDWSPLINGVRGAVEAFKGFIGWLGEFTAKAKSVYDEGGPVALLQFVSNAIATGVEEGWPLVSAAFGGIVTRAGEAIETNWPAISATLGELIGRLLSAGGQAIESNWPAITTALGTAGGWLLTEAQTQLGKIKQYLVDHGPEIATGLGTMLADGLINIGSTFGADLVKMVANAVMGLGGWAQSGESDSVFGAFIGAFVGRLGDWLRQKAGDIAAEVSAAFGGIVTRAGEAIETNWPAISATLGELIGRLLSAGGQAIESNWPAITTALGTAGGWLLTEAQTQLGKIKQYLVDHGPEIATGLGTMLADGLINIGSTFGADLVKMVANAVMGLGGWAQSGESDSVFGAFIGAFVGRLGDWLRQKADDIAAQGSVGRAIVEGMANGFRENWDNYANWLRGNLEWLVRWVIKPALDWPIFDIGKAITEGLWRGISDQWDRLTRDVGGLFNGLVGWLQNLLGINSPSKLITDKIAMPMGDAIPPGIAQGIAAGRNLLTSAVGDLTNPISLSSGASGGNGVMYITSNQQTTNNYFNQTVHSSAPTDQTVTNFTNMKALANAGV
ncbi:MAG: hypothetical protein GFH25_541178n5 [Chloroflexi bacterium AL-N10]|nr:hypothetical protein [Chloroflexi bacterium AL-N10]NOK75700.1 hypothetical protein [Chloroflexi bacterium AL-N5]NOK87056.1 hypothetical protein [Chloroflexi bacterium AL-N15]